MNLDQPITRQILLHVFWKRTSEDNWNGMGPMSNVQCPSCHPTISVKAPKETQSTDPKISLSLVLSSLTARLKVAVLLTLCQPSDTSTRNENRKSVKKTVNKKCKENKATELI